jgi:hypothetical protein
MKTKHTASIAFSTQHYNDQHVSNIARLSTVTINWQKDRFIATYRDSYSRARRYGVSAESALAAARKVGGNEIKVYSAQLRARVL